VAPERADKLTGGRDPAILDTLAAAYAETGRYPEAVKTAATAVELATQQKSNTLADGLRQRLVLYRAGKPYRDGQ
jgi:hypothetical protein